MIGGRVERLTISGFRSLRKLSIPLDHLSVYHGANGTGKTNIYRALELCHHAAIGDISSWLAKQGGMASAQWAGEVRKHENTTIDVKIDLGDYRYSLTIGKKSITMAAFEGEPLIKHELLEQISGGRNYLLMERKGPSVKIRNRDDKISLIDIPLLMTETALANVPASMTTPEIAAVRETFLDWRFYHAFRVDPEAPIRQPCHAVTATKLDADGSNLPAVFATLKHIRADTTDLDSIISSAFGEAQLIIPEPYGEAKFQIIWPDLPFREFEQKELSDGTLQFLALSGALLSYHTPELIVLNEPETSLHPDMMPALAELISKAAEKAQVFVVTHSERLTQELETLCACPIRTVYKHKGETKIENLGTIGEFQD